MDNDITPIARLRAVYYTTKAAFPTTGLFSGDLAYATDEKLLYRWNGTAWQAITVMPNAAGTYTGDSTQNRAITHGLGTTPDLVLIMVPAGFTWGRLYDTQLNCHHPATGTGSTVVTSWTDTYFYIGDNPATVYGMNSNTVVYRWVALATP